MRITQGMLSNNMLQNLSGSYSKMDKYMNQLNTGKKINRPSEDPIIAIKGMSYRTQVRNIEQYQKNASDVHNWMDNTDATLDSATKAMQRIKELAVKASNDTNSGSDRLNIKEEIEQIKEHLFDLANTNVSGKYIFNGTNTDKPAIEKVKDPITGEIIKDPTTGMDKYGYNYKQVPPANPVTYGSNPVNIEIASGTNLKINVAGETVFGPDMFKSIDDLILALKADNQVGIDTGIKELETHTDEVINTRADLGARMNRLDLIENRLAGQVITAKQTMSENENVDYEEAITNMLTQESLHRAALAAGSKVIQPSLIDFLR